MFLWKLPYNSDPTADWRAMTETTGNYAKMQWRTFGDSEMKINILSLFIPNTLKFPKPDISN